MARIVVSEFVTVDGVVDSPGGEQGFDRAGWAFQYARGDEGDKYKFDELMRAGSLLLGRKTYEGFAAVWPTVPEDETGFVKKFNTMPKYVLSSTLDNPSWANTTVLRGFDEISALGEKDGDDVLVHGSGQLAQGLIARNLVDEFRLMVFPTILGAGRRLWGDTPAAASLKLVETRAVGDQGVMVVTYQPV
jgi:dihydrofolate reductase